MAAAQRDGREKVKAHLCYSSLWLFNWPVSGWSEPIQFQLCHQTNLWPFYGIKTKAAPVSVNPQGEHPKVIICHWVKLRLC